MQYFSYFVYLFYGIAILLLWGTSGAYRNLFLHSQLSDSIYYKIRCIENLALVSMMVFALLCHSYFIHSIILVILAIGLAFFNNTKNNALMIPTPFYRYPFEFTIGFRKSLWIIGILYLLHIWACIIDNFGLSIFSMIGIIIIVFNFYKENDNPYFV